MTSVAALRQAKVKTLDETEHELNIYQSSSGDLWVSEPVGGLGLSVPEDFSFGFYTDAHRVERFLSLSSAGLGVQFWAQCLRVRWVEVM